MLQLLVFVGISLGLHIVFLQAARAIPRERPVDTSDWPSEMLAAVAARADRFGTLAALCSFLILLPLWFTAAYWLDFLLLPEPGPGEFVAVPLHWGRWIRGFVAAFVLAGIVGLWVMRLIFGWRYDLMMAAGNRAFGYSATAFFYWTLVWILPFCFEYEIHSLGNSVHIAADAIVVRENFYSPIERHNYRQLARVELARPYLENRAEIGRSPECRIRFQDGFALTDVPWPFAWDDQGDSAPNIEGWCNFVSRQSGVPVTVVPRIE
jgi:hypothetical protein